MLGESARLGSKAATAARVGGVLLAVAAWLPAGAPARKPKPTPCAGTFVVSGAPLVGAAGALATPDVLVIGKTISAASGCPPVPVKRKVTKKGTQVKAAWRRCTGITGKATISGRIPTGCGSFSGTFVARKAKIRRAITAARSSCGDGVFDPSNETCDGADGCSGAQACQADCTCGGGTTTCGPGVPQAQMTQGGTLQAGQPVTFDGRGSSDPDGDALVWSWSFGDGQRAGGAQVAHVFASGGQRFVRLTVSDGCGHTATSERTLDIAPGPAPTATTQARGKVRDTAGAPVAGAQVTAVPGGSATSTASGDVTVSVGQGVKVRITVTKAGYAEQAILTEVPDLPEPDAYFEATLVAREAARSLANAAAGGSVAGKDGATVVLPPNGLIDDGGNPVTGAVDVFITPVDVTRDIEAFPGRAYGIGPDGTQTPIVTYGTVEYTLQKAGAPLNLAPGALATIEIPVYATKNLDGSLLAVGDTFPLWSFDATTAQWIQEGQGTVVQSAGSPTGLALRGQVAHFSFWNHDIGGPPYNPKPKCLVDTNADGILEDLTGTGHCWHAGTGPEQPDNGFGPGSRSGRPRAGEVPAPRFPNWIGQEVLPAAGGKILPCPANMDIMLHSHAKGGTLRGSKLVRGPVGLEEDVIVVLTPVDVTGNQITIPFEGERRLSAADSLHAFDFDGTAGQTVFVTVDKPAASQATDADVTLLLPDGSELGPVDVRPRVNRAGRIGLVLPTTGRYRITVNKPLASFDGSYRIQVGYTADFPIILSTSPPAGASGVATTVAPAVTFSQAVTPALSFDLLQAGGPIAGTTSVAGAVATFTPATPLIPGAGYEASVDGFRTAGNSFPNGFPRTHRWTFNVAETIGSLVPIGYSSLFELKTAADAAGNVYAVWQTYRQADTRAFESYAARYVPGVGWSPPTNFNDAAYIGGPSGIAVAVVPGGAVALWPHPSAGGQVSVYTQRFTPETGWGAEEAVEDVPGLFRQAPALAADAAGNLLALSGIDLQNAFAVYAHRFTVGGTWTAPEPIFGDAMAPQVAMNATGRAIATARSRVTRETLVRLFVPGQGWGATSTFEADSNAASVAIDGAGNGFVVIVSGNTQVVRRFDATTLAWSDPQSLPSGIGGCPDFTRVTAAADGHAFVSGCTSPAPGPGVFAVRYTPGSGGGWEDPEILGAGSQWKQVDLQLDAQGNAVAIWLTAPDGTEGHYKRFSVGSGWEAVIHDFTGPSGFVLPRLAVGGNGVAVVVFVASSQRQVVGVRLP